MGGRPERTRAQDRRPRSVEEKTKEMKKKKTQAVLPRKSTGTTAWGHEPELPLQYRASTAGYTERYPVPSRYLAGTTA